MEILMAIDLGNTKVQLVAAQEGFRDEELFVPEDIFSDAGAFVDIASNSTQMAHGTQGGEVEPDLAIFRIDVDSIDALVIAGGKGSPQYLWSNPDLLEKVREAYAKGKIVGAICISGVVLAQAGILKGKHATVFPDPVALAEYRKHGVAYENMGVVVDGNVVTASGPDYAKPFAEAILDLLRARLPVTP
jgi:protease I